MALNQVLNLKRYVYYHTGAGYVDNYDNIPDGKEDDWRSIFTAARNRFGNKDGMLFAPIVDGEFVMLRAFKGESVTASAIAGDINDLAGAPLAYLNAMEKETSAKEVRLIASRLSVSDVYGELWAPKLFDCLAKGVPVEVRTNNFKDAQDVALSILSLFPLEFANRIGFAISESPFADAEYVAEYEEHELKPMFKLYYGDADPSYDVVSFDLVKDTDNFNEMGQILSDMASMMPLLKQKFTVSFAAAFKGGTFDEDMAKRIAAVEKFENNPDRDTARKLLKTDNYVKAANWLIRSLGEGRARDDADIVRELKDKFEQVRNVELSRELTALLTKRLDLIGDDDVRAVAEYLVGLSKVSTDNCAATIRDMTKAAIDSNNRNTIERAFDISMLTLVEVIPDRPTFNLLSDFARAVAKTWRYGNYDRLLHQLGVDQRQGDALAKRIDASIVGEKRLIAWAVLLYGEEFGRIFSFNLSLRKSPDPYTDLIKVRDYVKLMTTDDRQSNNFLFDKCGNFLDDINRDKDSETLMNAARQAIGESYTGLFESVKRTLSDKDYLFAELDKLDWEERQARSRRLCEFFNENITDFEKIRNELYAYMSAGQAEDNLVEFRKDFVDGDERSAKNDRRMYFMMRRMSPIALTALLQAIVTMLFLSIPAIVAPLAGNDFSAAAIAKVFTGFFLPVFVIFPLIAFVADIAIYLGLKSGNRLARANKITFLCCALPMLLFSIGYTLAYFVAG